jgi:hypothetical protein
MEEQSDSQSLDETWHTTHCEGRSWDFQPQDADVRELKSLRLLTDSSAQINLIEVGDTSATGIVRLFLSSDIATGIRCEKMAILAFRSHRRGCNDDDDDGEEEDDNREEEGGRKSQDRHKVWVRW